jgi:hypothetical protein
LTVVALTSKTSDVFPQDVILTRNLRVAGCDPTRRHRPAAPVTFGRERGHTTAMGLRELAVGERRRRVGVDEATRRALQGFVLPIWIGAGLADWWCHRRTDIGHTGGAKESMIHAAMMLEGGLPTMLGLFCEVNAGVLAITYTTLGLHELTDLGRRLRGGKAQGHTDRAAHPWVSGACAADGRGAPDRPPLGSSPKRFPTRGPAGMAAPAQTPAPEPAVSRGGPETAVGSLVGAPYAEELLRCLRTGNSPSV